MRAITVQPGAPGSIRLDEVAEPPESEGAVAVDGVAVGVCGTDEEIIRGEYGEAPPGRDRLVLGHESLGRVRSAPPGSGLAPGDLVVGIVRHPDPVPCRACAAGEWDLCQNGRYTEHGIKGRDGFAAERWRLPPDRLVRLEPHLARSGILLEPTSVVAKAWAHVDHFARRSTVHPRTVLVTGAGPIGLLAALLGRQRGLDVEVLDHHEDGAKPRLAAALGARYHSGGLEELCRTADVIIECTGVPKLVLGAMHCVRPDGIVCLTGLSGGRRDLTVDASALNRGLVLENNVVFGSVNANRAHYEQAAAALARADPAWLDALVTRRVPLARWAEAYAPDPQGVKTVLVLGE